MAAAPPPSKFESYFAVTKSLIIRAVIIYMVSSFFRGRNAPTDPNAGGAVSTAKSPASWNFFENGTMFDMSIYVSEQEFFEDFNNPKSLIWFQDGLVYGDWSSGRYGDGSYTNAVKITASEKLKNNGSIFMHIYVTKTNKSPDPASGEDYAGKEISYSKRMLNKFKKIKYTKTHNLLTGETDKTPEQVAKAQIMTNEIVSHWHPNLTISMVVDQTNWVKGQVPAPLDDYVNFLPGSHTYLPVIFVNDYWNMLRDYQPINQTTTDLELYLTYQPLSLFKFQLYAAQGMKNKWTTNMLGDAFAGEEVDEDQDSLKETLLETNPYLLGITFAISIFHTVFELLAFKNDIQVGSLR